MPIQHLVDLSPLSYHVGSKCQTTIDGGACTTCGELNTLEGKINEALSHLLTEHQKLRTKMNFAHSAIIRGLPIEVMSCIFEFCVPKCTRKTTFEEASRIVRISMVLSAVCQTWRQIAWSTPQLWTTIFIDLSSSPEILSSIQRSKTLPLTVFVRQRQRVPLKLFPGLFPYGLRRVTRNAGEVEDDSMEVGLDSDEGDEIDEETPIEDDLRMKLADKVTCMSPEQWHATLDLLAESSERWYNVRFHMKAESLQYLCSKVQDVALIHSLDLHVQDDLETQDKQILWKTQPPQPRYVTIFGLYVDEINISWENVIEVEAASQLCNKDCMDIIKFCPVLKSCTVQQFFPDPVFSAPSIPLPIIVHRNLRRLSFKSELFNNSFFSQVIFPGLTDLELRPEMFNEVPTNPNDTSLIPFIMRSGFSLTRLEIIDSIFPFEYFKSILELLPTLTHLKLAETTMGTHRTHDVPPTFTRETRSNSHSSYSTQRFRGWNHTKPCRLSATP